MALEVTAQQRIPSQLVPYMQNLEATPKQAAGLHVLDQDLICGCYRYTAAVLKMASTLEMRSMLYEGFAHATSGRIRHVTKDNELAGKHR